MKLRPTTVATIGAVLLLGTLAAPADAAAKKTSISVHVQNVKGQALKDVVVYAFQGKKTVVVGRTNAKGNLAKASGVQGTLGAGYWTLYFQDENPARYKATTSYAPKIFDALLKSTKDLNLKTRTLATGAHLRTSVATPSGLPVKGAAVRTQWTADPADLIEEGRTAADGTLHFFGIQTGTFYLRARVGRVYTAAKSVRVAKPGVTLTIPFKDVKLPCTTTFDAVPGEEPGTVRLTATASAAAYGVPTPGKGLVMFGRDGHDMGLETFMGEGFDITLQGQEPGDHTYSLTYREGDCRDWSSTTKPVSVVGPADPAPLTP